MSGSNPGAGDTAVTQAKTNYPINKYMNTNCDKNSESIPKADISVRLQYKKLNRYFKQYID